MGQGGGTRVPRLGATRSSDPLVVQAGPRLPTWINRLSVRLTQAPPGFWALRLAAGMKTQQGGPSWSPCWGGESDKQFQVFTMRSATKEKSRVSLGVNHSAHPGRGSFLEEVTFSEP